MKGNEYSIGQRMGAVRTKKKVKVQWQCNAFLLHIYLMESYQYYQYQY